MLLLLTMKKKRILSHEDVIQFGKNSPPTGMKTMTENEFMSWLNLTAKASLYYRDARCMLTNGSSGWKWGNIRVVVLFESDQLDDQQADYLPDELIERVEETEDQPEAPSPLDDIRKQVRDKNL